ncbi:MAG: hypothetical protein NVS9B10_16810 [Nevskia sp.]
MIRLQESLESPRSARECFRYAADFGNLTGWDPTAIEARKITPGPLAVGSAFDIVVSFGPKRLPMRYVITAFEPERRVLLAGDGETVSAVDEIRFEPLAYAAGGGTRVIYTADITLKDAGALTEHAARPIVALNGKRAILGLRRALAEDPPVCGFGLWRNLLDRTLVGGAARFTAAGYRGARLKPIADRLDGRTVVITGATSGIGRHAAEWLARLGARVVLVGRDAGKLAQARAEIVAATGNAEVATQQCELSLLAEVRRLAARLLADEPRIDVLINNAGAIYAERALTAEGHERSHATNLLSPYLLTELLLPRLAEHASADAPARVVNVSSGGMYLQKLQLDDLNSERGRYDGAKAYARAKRGQVALTVDWAEHWRARHVVVHAMHPGWVDTPGVAAALPAFHRRLRPWLRTPEQGADTIVWLAASPRAASCSGNFWLDRRPHLTDVLPGTTVHRDGRMLLRKALAEATRARDS